MNSKLKEKFNGILGRILIPKGVFGLVFGFAFGVLSLSLIYFQLFAPQKAFGQAAQCQITSAIFNPSGNKGNTWYTDNGKIAVDLIITGNNCGGKTADVSLVNDGIVVDQNVNDGSGVDHGKYVFPASGPLRINLRAGEKHCAAASSPECQYYLEVIDPAGKLYSSKGKPQGELQYDCDGLCDESWVNPNLGQTGEGQVFNLNGIGLTLDTYVSGSANTGNYARVGFSDGTLQIRGKVYANKLQRCEKNDDSCMEESKWLDTNYLDSAKDKIFFRNNTNSAFEQFGIGVKAKANIAEFNCFTDSRWSATYGNSAEYMNCNFPPVGIKAGPKTGIIYTGRSEAESVVWDASVSISSSAFSQFGLAAPAAGEKFKRASLYVFYFIERGGFRDSKIVFQPGKEIIVDVYPTQAAANADTSPPEGVPSYGSVATQANVSTPSSGITKLINDIFTSIGQFFINLTYSLFTKLISPMLEGMLSVRVYTDGFVNIIYPGWEILRNVCNIYFILAIIAIAMGTLFRVESYKYKHLLVQLIIAALTVNFSLIISQAVLGVADTVQNQFLPNNSAVIKQLGKDLMPARIQEIVNSNQLVSNSVFASSITTLFLMSMAVGSFMVFCGILVFLMIRIVMLWMLLLLSPLAYAAGVLPSTSNLRGQWWGEFLKYAFFTPILAFFLNMAAIIAGSYEFVFADITTGLAGGSGYAALVLAVASNVLLLVFLVAAMKISEKFGVIGADKIGDAIKKGMFMPWKMAGGAGLLAGKGAKLATGYAAQKYQKATGIELRPSEWKHAWETYRKKRKAEDKVIGGQRAEERREHGSEFLAKLGAPEDFFRVFLNPIEWKRIAKGGQSKALKKYHEASKLEDELKNLLSESDKVKLEAEIKDIDTRLKANADSIPKDKLNVDESNKVVGQMNRLMMEKLIALMEDKAGQLRMAGDDEGSRNLGRGIAKLKKDLAEGKKELKLSDYYKIVEKEKNKETGEEIIKERETGLEKEMANLFRSESKDEEKQKESLENSIKKKTVLTDSEIFEKRKLLMELRRQADSLRSPESYEHRLERMHLESEESSKLRGIDNAEQLQALAIEAIRTKNRFRMAAIHKKMAEDYNDNEFLNLTPRTQNGKPVLDIFNRQVSYGSGAQGMKDYMEEVYINQMGMDRQSALQLVDEISYINEKKNHWANARSVKYHHGELHYNTEEEQTMAAMVEITKRGPRDVAREFNRLAIGHEVQLPDGSRVFTLDKLGIAFAKIVGAQLHAANQMGFMTGSMLRRFTEPHNIEILRKNGVPEGVIEDMQKRARTAALDPVDVVKKAHLD